MEELRWTRWRSPVEWLIAEATFLLFVNMKVLGSTALGSENPVMICQVFVIQARPTRKWVKL